MTDAITDMLIRARTFVERGWCQGASARAASGHVVHAKSDRAVAWCAWGALVAAGAPKHDPMHPAFRLLTTSAGADQIVVFNDQQTAFAPILAAFDRAIATSQTEGASQ